MVFGNPCPGVERLPGRPLARGLRARGWEQWARVGRGVAIAGVLGLGAIACSPSPSTPAWKTYDNSGWGFEFPYPSTWLAQPAPSKQDGQSFTDPQNAAVEVRGWATVKGVSVVPRSLPAPIQNFQTAQGWLGNLRVEIGRETSTMTLILQGGQTGLPHEKIVENMLSAPLVP